MAVKFKPKLFFFLIQLWMKNCSICSSRYAFILSNLGTRVNSGLFAIGYLGAKIDNMQPKNLSFIQQVFIFILLAALAMGFYGRNS